MEKKPLQLSEHKFESEEGSSFELRGSPRIVNVQVGSPAECLSNFKLVLKKGNKEEVLWGRGETKPLVEREKEIEKLNLAAKHKR